MGRQAADGTDANRARGLSVISANISWSWRQALFGAVISVIGATVIAFGQVHTGLGLLFGALPAAIVGLGPTRRQRLRILIMGVLFGVFLLAGSVLAQWPVIAVLGMFALALGASLLASQRPLGLLALSLCVPLAGIGLSYAGVNSSLGFVAAIIGGSIVAYLLSMAFPEYTAAPRPRPSLMSRPEAWDYGIRLGLAAAVASGIGFATRIEHVGWITGATLLVMRPSKDMQELRSIGRVISVIVGAIAASWLLTLNLSPIPVAIIGTITVIAAAATSASRWYVTPAFTTFLVFWALLYGKTGSGGVEHRFFERVLETILGVGIAYFFGLLIPWIRTRTARRTADAA